MHRLPRTLATDWTSLPCISHYVLPFGWIALNYEESYDQFREMAAILDAILKKHFSGGPTLVNF